MILPKCSQLINLQDFLKESVTNQESMVSVLWVRYVGTHPDMAIFVDNQMLRPRVGHASFSIPYHPVCFWIYLYIRYNQIFSPTSLRLLLIFCIMWRVLKSRKLPQVLQLYYVVSDVKNSRMINEKAEGLGIIPLLFFVILPNAPWSKFAN